MQADRELDPIVEILMLAYRRGLAILKEQAKERDQGANVELLDNDMFPLAEKARTSEAETNHE